MIKYVLFALALTGAHYSAMAQDANNRNVACKSPVDTCRLYVTYSYSFCMDTIERKPYYDRQCLEIGTCISHYYSQYADMADSVMYKARLARGKRDAGIRPTAFLKANEKERYEDFWMNYPSQGTLSVLTGIYMREYLYQESIPEMVWTISDEQDSLMGYACHKARTQFRGRSYTVWFTLQIPTNYGPWKFNGLPGLILMAQDDEGLFKWTVLGIERPQNRLIYIYDPKRGKEVPGTPDMKIISTSRANMRKVQKKLWADPVGLQMSQGGTFEIYNMTTNKSKVCQPGDIVWPYIPTLELE